MGIKLVFYFRRLRYMYIHIPFLFLYFSLFYLYNIWVNKRKEYKSFHIKINFGAYYLSAGESEIKMKKMMDKTKESFKFVKEYFKWLPLPKWAKVIIVVLFFIFKWIIPDIILIPVLYSVLKFHAEKCGAEFLKKESTR